MHELHEDPHSSSFPVAERPYRPGALSTHHIRIGQTVITHWRDGSVSQLRVLTAPYDHPTWGRAIRALNLRTSRIVDLSLADMGTEPYCEHGKVTGWNPTNYVTATFTADDVTDILSDEGYPEADVIAAIDSLVDAGLSLIQPDDGWLLTGEELDMLRARPNSRGQ